MCEFSGVHMFVMKDPGENRISQTKIKHIPLSLKSLFEFHNPLKVFSSFLSKIKLFKLYLRMLLTIKVGHKAIIVYVTIFTIVHYIEQVHGCSQFPPSVVII